MQDSVRESSSEEDSETKEDKQEVLGIDAGSGWKGDQEPNEVSRDSVTTGVPILDFDLSVLMGEEPAKWFKVKIADIDYLKDDFNHESLRAYKQVKTFYLQFF